MTNISEQQDDLNKRVIAGMNFHHPLLWSPERERLLAEGTPAERDAYVKASRKRFIKGLLFVVAVIGVISLIPRETPPPAPEPKITSAGTVRSLQLHSTTFATETTVQTTFGTYQVKGGVSASVGDTATLKHKMKSDYSPEERLLCIESKIKSVCCRLL